MQPISSNSTFEPAGSVAPARVLYLADTPLPGAARALLQRTCDVMDTCEAHQALQMVRTQEIELLVVHTGTSGAQALLDALRSDAHTRRVPVVLVGDTDDGQSRAAARALDVADCIAGKCSERELAVRIESALRMQRLNPQTSTTLRRGVDRFREMADSSPVMIWVANPSGDVTFLNRVWSEFTGVAPEEAFGMRWLDLLHPEDRDAAIDHYLSACAEQAACRLEYRMRRADGAWRWAIDTAAPYVDALGEFHGYIGTVIDITERKEIEEGLHRTNVQLERQVEQRTAERDRIWHVSSELMTVAGYDGRLVAVNPAWTRTLGFDATELLAADYTRLVHPDDLDTVRGAIAGLRNGEPMLHFQNRLKRRDGTYRWISWTASADDQVFYAVGRDVTEEKEREQALAATEEALRQSQKMEAIGHLTGGVAHDFNNLLTVVIGNLDTVQRSLPEELAPRIQRAIANALHGAQRAASLTQQLLAFARRQPLDPCALDVNQLVASMTELLRRTLGENICIRTDLTATLWHAEADRNQLENALLNLAVNARDAMPNGGELRIQTGNVSLDATTRARPVDLADGDYVSIIVADTGCGMEPRILQRVFEPFFTTKATGHGTGLGLSQVYGFVKQSGGHVQIESTPGQGTSVRLYLPRLKSAQLAPSIPRREPAQDRMGHETVLVVEDEDSVRKYSCEVLRELGYGVIEARDSTEALRALHEHPHIALLFTDVGLPGLSGPELAARAIHLRPDLKILFTTGYASNSSKPEGRLDPSKPVINKPFTYSELAARIRTVLESAAEGNRR